MRAVKLNDRGARDVSFSILSQSEDDLNKAVRRLEEVLVGEALLANVATEGALPRPELQITPRVDAAARLGMTRLQAVIEAGHKRAQPIVMTSIAMSAGMLPSAVGVGESGAFRAPMATAVIGGIIVSTVLSLVVVPALYLTMDDLSNLVARLFRNLVGAKEAEPDALSPEELTRRLADRDADLATLRARLDRIDGGLGLPLALPRQAAEQTGPTALRAASLPGVRRVAFRPITPA